jgi:hypothetical protein
MELEKLTLLRDDLTDSVKASKLLNSERVSKLLKDNNLEVREVYSYSDRSPMLIVPGHAYSYKGYDNIVKYVNSLNPTHKQS